MNDSNKELNQNINSFDKVLISGANVSIHLSRAIRYLKKAGFLIWFKKYQRDDDNYDATLHHLSKAQIAMSNFMDAIKECAAFNTIPEDIARDMIDFTNYFSKKPDLSNRSQKERIKYLIKHVVDDHAKLNKLLSTLKCYKKPFTNNQ